MALHTHKRTHSYVLLKRFFFSSRTLKRLGKRWKFDLKILFSIKYVYRCVTHIYFDFLKFDINKNVLYQCQINAFITYDDDDDDACKWNGH